MGEFRLPARSDFGRNDGAKWYECVKCGAKRVKVLVHFDSGSVAPIVSVYSYSGNGRETPKVKTLVSVGEKITGAGGADHDGIAIAASGDTAIVERYTVTSGSFAGGNAAGVIEATVPTGYDDNNLEIFKDNENLNGASAGANFATVNGIGAVQISGRLIPDSDIVEYNGKNYCRNHFRFMFEHEWADDARIDTTKEGDRE
jgi:hypothetical protein